LPQLEQRAIPASLGPSHTGPKGYCAANVISWDGLQENEPYLRGSHEKKRAASASPTSPHTAMTRTSLHANVNFGLP
jgi:hypothetical protein